MLCVSKVGISWSHLGTSDEMGDCRFSFGLLVWRLCNVWVVGDGRVCIMMMGDFLVVMVGGGDDVYCNLI